LFAHIHKIDTRAAGSGLVVYGAVLLLVLYAAPSGAAGLVRGLLRRPAFLRRKTDPSLSDTSLV